MTNKTATAQVTQPKKTRHTIPATVRETVNNEFHNVCAICARVRPQMHHIDEDPSNNHPLNLIPLCANHHLTDQHNPTRKIEQGILRLFRVYKDPAILTPQFQPLYKRLKCVEEASDIAKRQLTMEGDLYLENWHRSFGGSIHDLKRFVRELNQGGYYFHELGDVFGRFEKPKSLIDSNNAKKYVEPDNPVGAISHRIMQQDESIRLAMQVEAAKSAFYDLVMELLRYQYWLDRPVENPGVR